MVKSAKLLQIQRNFQVRFIELTYPNMIEFELPASEHTSIDELHEAVGWIFVQIRGIELDLLHFCGDF